MLLARLTAAVSLFLGAFCPVGTHALAHAVDLAHVHGHEDGTVHAHEHDAEGHHHEHEVHDADDAPRIAASSTKLAPRLFVEWPAPAAVAPAAAFSAHPVCAAILDPPFVFPQGVIAPSSAGRAPPA